MNEYGLTEEEKDLLKNLTTEGWGMAIAISLKGDELEFFAKGFAMGRICAQSNPTNPLFKETIKLWNDLKQAMQKEDIL